MTAAFYPVILDEESRSLRCPEGTQLPKNPAPSVILSAAKNPGKTEESAPKKQKPFLKIGKAAPSHLNKQKRLPNESLCPKYSRKNVATIEGNVSAYHV